MTARSTSWSLLALLLLALPLAAWQLPGMLDWNRYRGAIAALAAETLGRSVRIDGPIDRRAHV